MEIVKVISEIKTGESRTLKAISREVLDSIRSTVSRLNSSYLQSQCDGQETTVIMNAEREKGGYSYKVTLLRYPGRLPKKNGRYILPVHPLAD